MSEPLTHTGVVRLLNDVPGGHPHWAELEAHDDALRARVAELEAESARLREENRRLAELCIQAKDIIDQYRFMYDGYVEGADDWVRSWLAVREEV